MLSSNGGRPGMGVLPHSLLEKEIRQIMNQSQLVPSTIENELSFVTGSNLRKMANQRMSAMSNYQSRGGASDNLVQQKQQ